MKHLAAVAVVLGIAGPTSAWADGRGVRIAVLPAAVAGSHGSASPSQIFESVSRALHLRVGLAPASYNEVFIDGTEPLAATARACGAELDCVARALRATGMDLGLQVIVNFGIDPPLVSLSLIDAATSRAREEAALELPLDGVGALEAMADPLLERAGFPRGGRLQISVEPADATLTIAGDPAGGVRDPSRIVRPGIYTVLAEHPSFDPSSISVTVAPGSTAEARLVLTPKSSDSGILSSPWFWVAVGAVVAGGVTAALVATDPFGGPGTGCLCVSTAGTPCPPCP